MSDRDIQQLVAEADALYSEYDLEAALAVYREVLVLDEEQAWSHSRIGAILAQVNKLDEAEEALQRAIQLNPSLAQAQSNLGNVYYTRGDFSAALERYKRALELDPDNAVFHENLHAAYKKLGRVTEAVGHLKRANSLRKEVDRAQAKEKLQGMKRRVGCFGTSLVGLLLLLVAATFLS